VPRFGWQKPVSYRGHPTTLRNHTPDIRTSIAYYVFLSRKNIQRKKGGDHEDTTPLIDSLPFKSLFAELRRKSNLFSRNK
jgi:hypothetical protein